MSGHRPGAPTSEQPLMRRQCQIRLRQNRRRAAQEPECGRQTRSAVATCGERRFKQANHDPALIEGPVSRRNPATWLRDHRRQADDGRGFLDSQAAFPSGCVAQVTSLREIDILSPRAAWLAQLPAVPRALLLCPTNRKPARAYSSQLRPRGEPPRHFRYPVHLRSDEGRDAPEACSKRHVVDVKGSRAMVIAGRGRSVRGGITPLRSVANAIQFCRLPLGRVWRSCEVLLSEP